MSLFACKDEKRRKRVVASQKLPRIDYYCPNYKCNAVLRLVDCDDEVRADHFRCKSGYSHIENCPYAKNDLFLQMNNFTNAEIKDLEIAIRNCKKNVLRLDSEFKNTTAYRIKKDYPIIYNAFFEWLGCDLSNDGFFSVASERIAKLADYITTFSVDKFKFYQGRSDKLIASCWPFTSCRISLSNLFFSMNEENDDEKLRMQGVIFHEATHQKLWTHDVAGYGKGVKDKSYFSKRKNAENWEECFLEILYRWYK